MTTERKAPSGISAGARSFWRQIASKYELRPDEYALLDRAVRVKTRLETLDKALETADLTHTNRYGEVVINPLMKEVRAQELVLSRLLAQLGIPDDESASAGKPGASSLAGAALVRKRWDAKR